MSNCSVIGGTCVDKDIFICVCKKLINCGVDQFFIKHNSEHYDISRDMGDLRDKFGIRIICVDNKFIYETHESLYDQMLNIGGTTQTKGIDNYLAMLGDKIIILKDDKLKKNIELYLGMGKDFYVL